MGRGLLDRSRCGNGLMISVNSQQQRQCFVIDSGHQGGNPVRETARPTQRVRFGSYEVDLRSGELRKNGLRLPGIYATWVFGKAWVLSTGR